MVRAQRTLPIRHFNARTRLLTAAVAACYVTAPAWALPSAPIVTSGSATFTQSGNALTVTNSNGAIINWNAFSIGANETTRFVQPSASSSVLNRVVGADPSQIYGTLSSNGRVWLINTAGILVGPGARIDTAAFVASTLQVRDADFLAGRLAFQSTPGAGNVVNQGTITTPAGGSVYLVGANAHKQDLHTPPPAGGAVYRGGANDSNEALIPTPGGDPLLAAGQTVNLIDTGTPGVKVEITGTAGDATNLGQIVADAGRIGIAGVIVRNSGTLNASSVVNEGGRVFLKASQDTYVDGAGRIVATGSKGGRVEVLGNRVAVMDNASIDASGSHGGGTILVGGDYQGKNPDVQNAYITYFGPNARLRADATDNGGGGKVIVWADDTTRAYGEISARGGAASGNGGFVETSGHRYLDFNARVDTSAPSGQTGSLLLDPDDLVISDVAPDGSFLGFFMTSSPNPSTLSWATIASQLNSTNVTVTTQYGGNITLNQLTPWTYNSSNTLGFNSSNNIILGTTSNPTTIINNATSGGGISFTAAGGIYGSNLWYPGMYMPPTAGLNIQTPGNISFTANGVSGVNGNSSGIFLGNGSIVSTTGTVNLSAPYGSIGIGYVKAPVGVVANAGYSIWNENWQTTSHPTNIETNGAVTLTSAYGQDPYSTCFNGPCSTIQANIAGAPTSVTATINSGATVGGIGIHFAGDAPSSLAVTDNSTPGYNNWVEVHADGNFNTAGKTFFGSSVRLTALGNLTYQGGISGPGTLEEIDLAALGNVTINSSLPNTLYFTGLLAGSTLNINANVSSSGNIAMGAGFNESMLKTIDSATTAEQLVSTLALSTGVININNAQVVSAYSLPFMAGTLNMTGSTLQSTTGDILGVVGGDMVLNNGSRIRAGYDVDLALLGSTSTLYLNKLAGLAASKVEVGLLGTAAGLPSAAGSATNLLFPARASGGVVIDGAATTATTAGGSGFYAYGLPAVKGAGLNITYGLTSLADPCAINPASCAPPPPPTNPPSIIPFIPPPSTGGDGTLLPGSGTIGGGEDQFGGKSSGDKENGKDKKSSDSSSGDKKDDKSGKKSVGKCSA